MSFFLIMKKGISKIELSLEDIETILNTLVYDGKVERSVMAKGINKSSTSSSTEQISLYRAINPTLDSKIGSGLIRTPCGICPIIDNCHPDGVISPQTCAYMKEWLEF